MEKKEKNKSKYFKLVGALSLIINALGVAFIIFNPKRWHKFVRGQKKEITELSEGKQNLSRFTKDSAKLLKDLFVPNEFNDHKPKILRPKSLLSFAVVAVSVKLLVTGFLFFTYPTPAQLSAIISSNMMALINQSRTEAGVEPLTADAALLTFAEAKGADMLERDYFAHDTPEGKRPWQWIDRGDYDYVYAGENLAMDFTSAEIVHDAFMKSPGHRRNILNPKYKNAGIAVLEGEMNGRETILLVEFFGTQRQDLSATLAGLNSPGATNDSVVTDEETAEVSAQPVETDVLAAGTSNEGVIVVTTQPSGTKPLVNYVIEYSNIFFIAFLLFILLSLMLNIFIKIKVQHTSVILQSLVVIALLVSMILVKFHFVEQIAPQILIL